MLLEALDEYGITTRFKLVRVSHVISSSIQPAVRSIVVLLDLFELEIVRRCHHLGQIVAVIVVVYTYN